MKKMLTASMALLSALCFSLNAQSYMSRAERFCADSVCRYISNLHTSVYWLDGGSRYFYYSVETEEGKNWCLADTKKNSREYFPSREALSRRMEVLGLSKKKDKMNWGGRDYRKKYSADSLFYICAIGDDLALNKSSKTSTPPNSLLTAARARF